MQKQTGLGKKLLFLLVGGAVFYFLGNQIRVNWQQVYPRLVDFNPFWGLAAIGLGMLHYTFCVLIWEVSLNKVLAVSLPLGKGFRIWSISQMGRYIPGKIWAWLGRLHLCEQENIPKVTTAISMSLELILVLVAAFFLFLAGLPFWPSPLPLAEFKWLLILLPGLLIFLHPRVFEATLNLFLRLSKQEPAKIKLGFAALLQLMIMALINWLLIGGALFCVIRTVHVLDLVSIPLLGGIFALAWMLGMLALFAPSGIGVREGALAYLLSFHLPGYIASIVAILSRLILLLAEGIFFAMVLAITRDRK